MSTILNDDYCYKLKKIPQFSSTCWFNSILTVMLYSEGFRRCLETHFNNVKKPRNDKLLTFLLFMLKNYNNIEQLEKVYKSFKDFRLKPEYILLSYLNKYDEITKKIFKKKIFKLGYQPIYITHILKSYNIPYINLIKYDTNIYINLKSLKYDMQHLDNVYNKNDNIENFLTKLEDTNILILNVNNINNKIYNTRDIDKNNIFDDYKSKISNYPSLIKDINNIAEEISINNHTFKLDCCIITNDYTETILNVKEIYHAIACISCNNKKYIIDSQNNFKFTNDNLTIHASYLDEKGLLPFDWLNNLKNNSKFYIENDKVHISNIKQSSLMSAIGLNKKISYNLKNSPILFFYIKKNFCENASPLLNIKKIHLV
jgi:hypothetical protein